MAPESQGQDDDCDAEGFIKYIGTLSFPDISELVKFAKVYQQDWIAKREAENFELAEIAYMKYQSILMTFGHQLLDYIEIITLPMVTNQPKISSKYVM